MRRRPALYLLAAAGLAAGIAVALETAGSKLTSSYSGLGGKLETSSGAAVPASVRSQ